MARVSSPVFVGRVAELDRLRHALDGAVSGRAATRLVAGEAGIGKTRLVDEFLRAARDAGAVVLRGECLPMGEAGPAYAPLVAALRPVIRDSSPEELDALIGPGRHELGQLMPGLGAGLRRASPREPAMSATAAQARLFEVVFALLLRLSADRPTVLAIEDLHWVDSSTGDLLRFLVRTVRQEPLLILATYRSDELHRRHPLRPLLAELQRLDTVDVIDLPAFRAEEVADQLTGILGSPPPPALVESVLARSGGNPFFAEELMAAGEAGLALPRSLRDTLGDRVRQLPEDAQDVVRVASVSGARVDHRILAEVIGWPEEQLTDALRDVVEHHLLVPTAPEEAPGYAFRHALLQESVYEELLPSERTQLHAAYAQALGTRAESVEAERSATTAQVAHHWLMAHDLERALTAALAAARAAAAGFAFAEARTFLERALELWPKVNRAELPSDLDRIVILEEAAEASAQSGDARRSIDLVRAALAELDPRSEPMRSGVLYHRLAWYLNESGDWQAGVAAMERAVELTPIEPPSAERARVLADLAHSLMGRGRYGDSLVLGEAALAISRATGARVAEARALNVIGLNLACRSDFERAIPVLREGHELAVELGEPVAIFLTGVGLAWALDGSARHAEALELSRATSDRLAHLGASTRFGGQLASVTARSLYFLGRWDESAALIDDTIAAGTTRYALRWLLSNRLRLRAGRGQLDEARRDQSMYDALGERVIGPDPDLMDLRRAELAIAAGTPAVARGLVRAVLDRMAEEADLARAAGDGTRVTAAEAAATELAERLHAHVRHIEEMTLTVSAILPADAALGSALLGRALGRRDPDAWVAAVDARRALGRPYELATTLAQAAAVLLGADRRDAGVAAVTEAHAIAVELGAAPLRERVESLARRARIGLDGVGTIEDTVESFGLTPREREVLALLADGRSNRQIGERLYMAESTAGVHVSHILGKLGVTRRSEAAALAHRLGLVGLS